MATLAPNKGLLRLTGAMRTDVGCVRTLNEDTVAYLTPSSGSPESKYGALALVADGMGGHAAGEIASAIAAEVVWRVFYSVEAPAPEALRKALEMANRAIRDYATAHPSCNGMGTTCTALGFRDDRLWLAHIGDSRAYIFRDRQLTQLSDDQTLHAQMVREGLLHPDEAGIGPGSNVILQALGTREEIEPTIWSEGLQLKEKDIVLLCSDGLFNLVDDDAIATILAAHAPTDACRLLIEDARAKGGHDNISVGVFLVEAGGLPVSSSQLQTKPIEIDGSGAPTVKISVYPWS